MTFAFPLIFQKINDRRTRNPMTDQKKKKKIHPEKPKCSNYIFSQIGLEKEIDFLSSLSLSFQLSEESGKKHPCNYTTSLINQAVSQTLMAIYLSVSMSIQLLSFLFLEQYEKNNFVSVSFGFVSLSGVMKCFFLMFNCICL